MNYKNLKRISCALLFAATVNTGTGLGAAASAIADQSSDQQTAQLLAQAQSPAPSPAPAAPAATITLSERTDYIGTCRGTTAAVNIYEDTQLTRRVGTVAARSSVTLTGILGNGIAQIRTPSVGWIQTTNLVTNCTGGNPGDNPGNVQRGECRRLRDPDVDGAGYESLRFGLRAYDNPGTTPQTYQGSSDGPAKGARIFLTKPSQTNGKWIRVFYTSVSGRERLGWISGGTGTTNNLANCPANR
ncbi:hypothetical protein H6F90_22875 [Trichocoleus sp. FACHB-591]|uniref:hypothetical protein n=1 Tax=Trichocoleus sp. FACHB-591 TaxID=2692872 RepID=UPI001689D82D|nr:hypothetical protein [Trichocoleus sp. FACHB-591]MBD2097919.1 hypothetical protein [Trichocoleus sp. FACHB-591]